MKAKIVLLVVILAVLLVIPFFLKRPDGSPLMELPKPDTTISTEQTRQTFYKWQDAKGHWHFGDEVPDGVTAVPVSVDTAANIMQSVKAPQPAATKTPKPAEPAAALPGLPMTVNPAEIPKLIEDAKNVQNLLDEHNRQLEQQR